MKLEELRKQITETGTLPAKDKMHICRFIDNLLELPYHETPGWKEIENP